NAHFGGLDGAVGDRDVARTHYQRSDLAFDLLVLDGNVVRGRTRVGRIRRLHAGATDRFDLLAVDLDARPVDFERIAHAVDLYRPVLAELDLLSVDGARDTEDQTQHNCTSQHRGLLSIVVASHTLWVPLRRRV